IKNFVKHNTPTRPDLKSELISLQEKERQRLESLRKKQEAEEERKKKVEEEKKRRQAEMKQKREERLRKALQARERVEQMEEEKKKRMEQKILQSDDKVRLLQVQEEKVVEERSKKKLSKKYGEADARKQKAPRVVRAPLGPSCEDELEQQEPLQKKREDEVKEKGRKVFALKNLVGQQQVEQVKESPQTDYPSVMEQEIKSSSAGCWGLTGVCAEDGGVCLLGCWAESSAQWEPEGKTSVLSWKRCWKRPQDGSTALLPAAGGAGCWVCRKSVSASCLVAPKGTKESVSPKVNENNYGMDLNSDDSTDDENEPRKPVPAWADGSQLDRAIVHQYYHLVNVEQIFGLIPSPKLEDIFGKSKPRYFKRTSSAVWHSPP
ncbi:INCE protein, partial [Chionis minor]|nr:INCE protein [Chionis minor]